MTAIHLKTEAEMILETSYVLNSDRIITV